MNNRVQLLGMALLVSAVLTAAAAHASSHKQGKMRSVSFITPVRVGGVVLSPGEYEIRELTDGDAHMLVFITSSGREKVRVPCKLAELRAKVSKNEQVTHETDGGERVLDSLAFAGEKIRHDIVNP